MAVDVQVSPETRRAQARYAITVRNHPEDTERVGAARRAWAECLPPTSGAGPTRWRQVVSPAPNRRAVGPGRRMEAQVLARPTFDWVGQVGPEPVPDETWLA